MRPACSKRRLAAVATVFAALGCHGQGTLQITFDGPPLPVAGQALYISSYSESGMLFRPGGSGFIHAAADYSPDYPYNGTPYLQGLGHSGYSTVYVSFNDGSLFGVSSIDVAAINTFYQDFGVSFAGRRSDGTFITMDFAGTGINFRTFHFDSAWSSDLNWFAISLPAAAEGWSVDNLVVGIPEPGTGALLVVGTLTFLFWRMKTGRL
jgi:hypothetical protein